MDSKKVIGVTKITEYINNEVIPRAPGGVSWDTVRRHLKAYECGSGGLVCEKREKKEWVRGQSCDEFEIYQTSLDALYDYCDTKSVPEIARFCGKSERWVKDKINYDPEFPVYVLFGRVYSTQESLSHYRVNYCNQPGNHKPTKMDIKRWTHQS